MNSVVTADRKIVIPLDDLIGSFRRFGIRGPIYEILSVSGEAVGPDVELRIRVVESGEELDYPLKDVLADPVVD